MARDPQTHGILLPVVQTHVRSRRAASLFAYQLRINTQCVCCRITLDSHEEQFRSLRMYEILASWRCLEIFHPKFECLETQAIVYMEQERILECD
jgi:hypothetical protein